MNKKPSHFLVFKIIGFIGVAVGIFGFVLSFSNFGNFGNNLFMIGGFLGMIGMFVGIVGLFNGFRPELSKMGIKSAKYIQEENKEDFKDMANTTVDITSEAITKVTRSIKNGLEEEKVYCKHCGSLIDADSKFCRECGKEQ